MYCPCNYLITLQSKHSILVEIFVKKKLARMFKTIKFGQAGVCQGSETRNKVDV